MAVVGVSIVAVVAFFFFAPVFPYSNFLQTAGFFPRYVSLSCMVFHVGVAYGFGGFPANHIWHLEPFCNIFTP